MARPPTASPRKTPRPRRSTPTAPPSSCRSGCWRASRAPRRLTYAALRYFNVAGSDTGGRIGQATPDATLLIKVACEVAVGKRPHVSIYGTDYPTQDGTGVRDYIHVEDLAAAHLDALAYLRSGGASTTLNVGYGHGHSVREVLSSVERIAGQPPQGARGAAPPGRSRSAGGTGRPHPQGARLAPPAGRPRHHRAHRVQLGRAHAARAVVSGSRPSAAI